MTVGPGIVVAVGLGDGVLEGLVVVDVDDGRVVVELEEVEEVVVTEREVVLVVEGDTEEVVGRVIAEVVGIAVVRGVGGVAVVVAGAPGRATVGGNVVPP